MNAWIVRVGPYWIGFWLGVVVASLASAAFGENLAVQYVSNYDGDTFTVNIPSLPDVFGKHLPVRLRGIDAPEMNGKCDHEKRLARDVAGMLRRILTPARTILLQDVSRDKYFRLGAVVIVDGININDLLLDIGAVRPYDGGTRQSWCPSGVGGTRCFDNDGECPKKAP